MTEKREECQMHVKSEQRIETYTLKGVNGQDHQCIIQTKPRWSQTIWDEQMNGWGWEGQFKKTGLGTHRLERWPTKKARASVDHFQQMGLITHNLWEDEQIQEGCISVYCSKGIGLATYHWMAGPSIERDPWLGKTCQTGVQSVSGHIRTTTLMAYQLRNIRKRAGRRVRELFKATRIDDTRSD